MLTLVLDDESAPPCPPDAGRLVNEWRDDLGAVFARAYRGEDGYHVDWRGLGVLSCSRGSTVVRLWPDPHLDPSAARDIFARIVQPVVLQAVGLQCLHASAVCSPTGAIAFCGQSGAGKSTLAYALGREPGFVQLADDAVVMAFDAEVPEVVSLAFTPRLRARSRDALVRIDEGLPSARSADRAPLRAIFLLTQDDALPRPVRLERLAPSSAFVAVVTHAHCIDEGDPAVTRQLIDDYLRLVQHAVVYRLWYRPDFRVLPDLLKTLRETCRPRPALHAGD
jgi:hypothetical protein